MKEAILNEKDDKWMRYKYLHIFQLTSMITEERERFQKEKQHIAELEGEFHGNAE
jgi:hypothetical protein